MRLDGELKRQKEAAELGEMKTTETEVKRRKVNWKFRPDFKGLNSLKLKSR